MIDKDNTPKAIFLIIFGMSIFALQDALIKYLSFDTNIFLIYLVRAFVGLSLLVLFLYIKNEPIIFKTHYPILTILRGVIFFFHLPFIIFHYQSFH